MVVSDTILDEAARVLRREKFGWPEEKIRQAVSQTVQWSDRVEPRHHINVIKDDPTDNRILECAAASESDFLISGDKHLLVIGQFSGVAIVKPTTFLEIRLRPEHGA